MTINEPSQFRKELTQFPRHALATPQAWRAPRRRTRSRRRSPSARRATTDRSHDLGRAGVGLGRRYEARPDSPRTRHGAHSWTLSKVFSFRFDDSWANISSREVTDLRLSPRRGTAAARDPDALEDVRWMRRERVEKRAPPPLQHTHTHVDAGDETAKVSPSAGD